MPIDTNLAEVANSSIRAAEHYRGPHPSQSTVSFVVVVGADDSCVVHPWNGDALMKLVSEGAPLKDVYSTRDL